MPDVADYKVIQESTATLNSIGDSLTVNFRMPAGALLVDGAQRPYITFDISASGAMPQTVSVTLNGASVNAHTYRNDSQVATRAVIVNGSTFVSDTNTLAFALTSGAGAGQWTVTVANVIVHFQRTV